MGQKHPAQTTLWDSWIQLSEEFFESITAAPVPVDMRALRALKRSPLALDLYAWTTYTAFQTKKTGQSRSMSWEWLHEQMGGEYDPTSKNLAGNPASLSVKCRLCSLILVLRLKKGVSGFYRATRQLLSNLNPLKSNSTSRLSPSNPCGLFKLSVMKWYTTKPARNLDRGDETVHYGVMKRYTYLYIVCINSCSWLRLGCGYAALMENPSGLPQGLHNPSGCAHTHEPLPL